VGGDSVLREELKRQEASTMADNFKRGEIFKEAGR